MTPIDLLTLVACLIAGSFVVRLGNQALREQRVERRHRKRERSSGEREQGDLDDRHADALVRLNEWRRDGLLVMSDTDYELAIELERHNPGQLDHLVKTTRRIIDETKLEPGDAIHLTVKVEYGDIPESTSNTKASKGHLELIAAFS